MNQVVVLDTLATRSRIIHPTPKQPASEAKTNTHDGTKSSCTDARPGRRARGRGTSGR